MDGAHRDNHDSLFGSPERLAELIVRYHDDDLSPAELDELRDALKHSAKARDLFVQWGLQIQTLNESLKPEYRDDAANPSTDVPGLGVVPASEQNYPQLLAELAQLEAKAQVIELPPSDSDKTPKEQGADKDPGSLSAHDLVAVSGYVLRQVLTSKAAVYAYTAAVVLLVGALLVPWGGGEETTPQPLAEDTPNAPADVQYVATLTAQHNAQWASQPGGDVRPGTQLAAGQKLNLTAGFATITTAHGAVASLEAPCTVELIDHNNAIRLHAGKLVGLCETESSKGFTVKTPHGDVIDLGTEFGVNVTPKQLTATVFTGEVTLTPPGGQAQPITTKQTAQLKVNGNDRRLVVREQLASGFDKVHAVALTKTATLPGTGQAAVGQTDPNWSIAAIDGLALLKPVAATVADPTIFTTTRRENIRFMPNGSASKWITPLPHYKPSESVEYQTTFDASGFDLETLSLELRLLADKRVTAIELNGRPVDVPTQGTGPAFTEMTELTLREGFLAGLNTLNITAQRHRTIEHGAFYWTGLRAELQLTSQRPSVGPNE